MKPAGHFVLIGFVSAMIVLGFASVLFAESIQFKDVPFEMAAINVPQFPDASFSISKFGAIGDGHTKNTEPFRRAIEACAQAGGGTVVVEPGMWLTGPIELKSNLNLYLEEGAVILFSTELADYPLQDKTFEGVPSVRRKSPISGYDVENIAITGAGIIDGSGQAWRPVKKEKLTEKQWKELVKSGGVVQPDGKIWWPSKEAMEGEKTAAALRQKKAGVSEYAAAGEFLRPVMVSLVKCRNVLLDGPTFQNSPAWNLHPLLCENLIIRNVTVRNPWWSQNGDGLDLESCRNAVIYQCNFDVGDDAMCMKSGKDEYGRKRGRPTENAVIRDCVVYHGHGGFVVGSEMSGGVRNIDVRNCVFLGTDVGLRFKSTRGRGGVVENIYIQDIRMKDIPTDAILFDLFYSAKSPGPEQSLDVPPAPVTEETPQFRNIQMKNIVCTMAENAIFMQGLPEMPVQKIAFENVVISAKNGITMIDAAGITFKNVRVEPMSGPVLGLYNSRNITFEGLELKPSGKIILAGDKTANILLKGLDQAAVSSKIEYIKDAKPEAVRWQ
ncbi:MAG: glycoside hydrolase family 28 protein [Planctomycetaceae bacterium]|nr:glycoside hydrolase family 28 protein [Planctomycetaceae bacterium]